MSKVLAAPPMFLDYIQILNCLLGFHFVFAQDVPYTLARPLPHIVKGHCH